MKRRIGVFCFFVVCAMIKAIMFGQNSAVRDPEPIATPAHADTAPPTSAPACLLYRSTLKENEQHISACINQFSSLCAHPQFGDDRWTMPMSTCLTKMEEYAIEGQSLSAPLRYQGVQKLYSKGTGQIGEIARLMPKAIARHDDAAMTDCAHQMNAGTSYVHQSLALLQKIDKS